MIFLYFYSFSFSEKLSLFSNESISSILYESLILLFNDNIDIFYLNLSTEYLIRFLNNLFHLYYFIYILLFSHY